MKIIEYSGEVYLHTVSLTYKYYGTVDSYQDNLTSLQKYLNQL